MPTKKTTVPKPKKKKAPEPVIIVEETTPVVADETTDVVADEATDVNSEDPIMEQSVNKGGDPGRPGMAFVIPFVDSTVKWEELRYALRSIARFGIPEDKVFIVASSLPDWVSDEVTLVECEQIKGKRFAKSFDAVEKLKAAIAHADIPDGFIYTYDDTVFLEPIDGVIPVIAVSEIDSAKITETDGSSIWKEVFSNTLERLRANDLPQFNYETHLPRTFTKRALMHLIEMYGFEKRPYLVATLYFNTFFDKPDFQLHNTPEIKADIRSELSLDQIQEAVEGRFCLNYNDAGLNQNLKDFLSDMFSEKCRFEK